ncbi:hypothetical protein HDU93_003567 [Gonapodya sp. JEL0774]|nr:hypothetical protein HDU93_003567 [Gonapodya sp. JEL0774]
MQDKYRPSHNVGPTRMQPVIVFDESGNKVLRSHKWGLIPFWSKSTPDYASMARTINARDDSILPGPSEKSMFRAVKNKRRCVVLAEGFYEWDKSRGMSAKVPYYVHPRPGSMRLPMDGDGDGGVTSSTDSVRSRSTTVVEEQCSPKRDVGIERMKDEDDTETKPDAPTRPTDDDRKDLFFMAGLWDKATLDGNDVYSYTIITTSSSPALSWLHDRMPVILSPSPLPLSPSRVSSPTKQPHRTAIDLWLDHSIPVSDPRIVELLRPFEGKEIEWWAVAPDVGNIKNDGEELTRPADPDAVARAARAKKSNLGNERGLQSIAGFFGKQPTTMRGKESQRDQNQPATQPHQATTEPASATADGAASSREMDMEPDAIPVSDEDEDIPRDDAPEPDHGESLSPVPSSAAAETGLGVVDQNGHFASRTGDGAQGNVLVTPGKRKRLLETDSEDEERGKSERSRGNGGTGTTSDTLTPPPAKKKAEGPSDSGLAKFANEVRSTTPSKPITAQKHLASSPAPNKVQVKGSPASAGKAAGTKVKDKDKKEDKGQQKLTAFFGKK